MPVLHDASNESRDFLRNRVRRDLIPSLQAYNPQVRRALWRLGHSAAADMSLIDQFVDEAWKRTVISQGPEYVGFSATGVVAEAPALQRRLIMRAALGLQPASELDFDDVQRAAAFLVDPSTRRLQLGDGLSLYRELQSIYMTLGEPELPSDQWPQMAGERIALGAERVVSASLAGNWHFTAELSREIPKPAEGHLERSPYRGVLDADSLPSELELRVPRPGDRVRPLGLHGHTQKLSDVFINIGVPERLRRRWPILVSASDVVWVPGFRIAEPYRIRTDTLRAVLVTVYRSE